MASYVSCQMGQSKVLSAEDLSMNVKKMLKKCPLYSTLTFDRYQAKTVDSMDARTSIACRLRHRFGVHFNFK